MSGEINRTMEADHVPKAHALAYRSSFNARTNIGGGGMGEVLKVL